MMSPFFDILTLLTFLIVTASACPEYPDPRVPNNTVTVEAILNPRWYTTTPSAGGPWPATWPRSTLPVCYETVDAKSQLAPIIKAAWKIWQSAGVNARIDLGEYNSCPAPLNGLVPTGPGYLLVSANAQGKISTTVGYLPTAAGAVGSKMNFDPSPAMGMRDPTANMAHELGHAWGFYHEQQRPSFWDKSQYQGATGASNQIIFTCSNLADYATSSGTLDGTINDACHSQAVAKSRGFSAAEYLPQPEQWTDQLETGTYDWNSVMLYGSKIGGVVQNGVPANVYTKADGTVVDYNKVPSQWDVERFMAMYSENAPYKNPCLVNQGCSPLKATFINMKNGCKKP